MQKDFKHKDKLSQKQVLLRFYMNHKSRMDAIIINTVDAKTINREMPKEAWRPPTA